MEKLHLEDALGDSPQTRSLLGVFENDSATLRSYVHSLHRCCNRVLTAQRELCAAMQFLSAHLKMYDHQDFPLESEDSVLSSVLNQFANYVDEMSSIQQVLISQLGDDMMHPINKFLTADLDEISAMKEVFRAASNEHERALAGYMKYPKKREGEKARQEAVDDLYVSRKKFHQTAMHYFALLNSLQYKRKSSLLEPLIGILMSQKTFYGMGHEVTSRTEFDEFVANIGASVQQVHNELKEESQKRVEQIETIERQSIHKYYAEVPTDVPYLPPDTNLAQKAGYLFLRSKQSLLTTRWDRLFFFIQGGNLMSQAKEEVAGSSLMDLNIETRVEQADVEDRRFVFLVSQPSTKKSLILQAESARERDEWMATILNVVNAGQRLVNLEVPITPKTPTDMGFTQSFLSSIPVAIPKVVEALRETSGIGRGSHPATPPSTPAEGGFCHDNPIQFDLSIPDDTAVSKISSAPLKRINPFDQMGESGAVDADLNGDSSQSFVVRFLGLQQVGTDRGESLVRETIRQVMAARAIHNVFKMCEYRLIVTGDSVKLIDEFSKLRLHINLEHISYWAVHNDNKRLFGFITRTLGTAEADHSTFTCYVFECNSTGEQNCFPQLHAALRELLSFKVSIHKPELCHSLANATQLAFQAFMQKKAQEMELSREKDILLSNIQQLPDQAGGLKLSADGQFVLLEDLSSSSAPPSENVVEENGIKAASGSDAHESVA